MMEDERALDGGLPDPVRSLVSQPPTLEDLFLRHYGPDPDAGNREDRKVHA